MDENALFFGIFLQNAFVNTIPYVWHSIRPMLVDNGIPELLFNLEYIIYKRNKKFIK
jgi:hypothetical protein